MNLKHHPRLKFIVTEFFANPEFKPDGSVMIGKPPVYRAEELYSMSDLPLEKMISGNVDISPIREQLLMPNPRLGDLIAEFWAAQN